MYLPLASLLFHKLLYELTRAKKDKERRGEEGKVISPASLIVKGKSGEGFERNF